MKDKPLILIAEDDAETRGALASWVREKDYTVVAVANGMDALKVIVNTDRPLIPILDWDLPRMSGVEILSHLLVIEQNNPDKFIYPILVSGKYSDWAPLGVDLGAKIFLRKPIDLEELEAFIQQGQRAIEKARRRRAEANDDLTGLMKQTKGVERLAEEISRAERRGEEVCCLFMDLDHFKSVNDEHGHQTGTDAIKIAAERISVHKRPYDVAIRYGGDEFCLILPGTSSEEALEIAVRIWTAISKSPFRIGKKIINLTSSIGVAVSYPGISPEELISCADHALYQAKANGRNGVYVYGSGATKNIQSSG